MCMRIHIHIYISITAALTSRLALPTHAGCELLLKHSGQDLRRRGLGIEVRVCEPWCVSGVSQWPLEHALRSWDMPESISASVLLFSIDPAAPCMKGSPDICIYIYIYILYIYIIYVYTYVYVYVCINTYSYNHRISLEDKTTLIKPT